MEDEANECLSHTNPFDEEFLRDILQQAQDGTAPDLSLFGETSGAGNLMMKSDNNSSIISQDKTTSSPTTYILSFDKSAALLPTHSCSQSQLPKHTLPFSSSRANHGTKKTRSASESLDHIMSERNRRQELTRKFIALAATIPGLKKGRVWKREVMSFGEYKLAEKSRMLMEN
ncbi:Transcription factor bHLH18, partial [Mucuna pruriens]